MAWHFDLNNSYAAGQPGEDSTGGCLYRLKALIAAHWGAGAIRGSGDGLAAYEDVDDATGGAGTGDGGAYDVITQESVWGGGVAGDMGNENAWFRARMPGGTRELLFWREAAFQSFGQGEGKIDILFSPTGFLTPGSAAVRAGAGDEIILENRGTTWGDSDFYSTAVHVHVGVDDAPNADGVHAWYMYAVLQGSSTTKAIAIMHGLTGVQPTGGDGEAWGFHNGGDAFGPTMQGWRDVGGSNEEFRTDWDYVTSALFPGTTPVQDDGLARVWQIPVYENVAQIFRGFVDVKDAIYKGSSTRAYPDTQDLAGADPRIYVDGVLLPWEQGTVPNA